MSEPSMWRTCPATGSRGAGYASRILAVALSLLAANTLYAADPAAPAQAAAVQAVQSDKAARSLLLEIAHAGSRLVVVGDRGHILYSDDQGKNWVQAQVPARQLLTAVHFVDARHGWAVGHDALILASEDGGQTWQTQFEDPQREAPLLDVWFKDARNGFAVGAYGTLLATGDGGRNWQDIGERLDNEDQYHLNGIAWVKDAGLFIVGEAGSMFRSTDDGLNWEKLEGPYQGSLFGVTGTAQASTLLVYGLRGNLFRSTDFGDSWTKIDLVAARGPLDFSLANATLLGDGSLVLVGNGGSVLRSSDDGRSFMVFNRPDRISLAGVTVNDQGNLVLVGQGGVHLSTPTGAELTSR